MPVFVGYWSKEPANLGGCRNLLLTERKDLDPFFRLVVAWLPMAEKNVRILENFPLQLTTPILYWSQYSEGVQKV